MLGSINNEDGEKVQALAGIMGDALPGAIAAINHADEMKADTEILDLPLAIKYFLEWSSDLPEYGMECKSVEWRPHATAHFSNT
ncbi:hypothetical protein HBI56_201380 [Parastagonospora nodorum]|nr:hypothetical protein HBI10_215450 [Parastagonospora nodorum]KAH4126481.1 hypothetical protein HBH45_221650 [Parastagonospora nodorum]KAH4478064.1 hypothetical protein HBH88_210110 [Parastagonospora nodorum]KAH4616460.1 hypothetical protein HBH55_205410 [Parastagonospora nodorum]KAH4813937.1 hypothetical protein HBH60_226060 [Parastagonospora nodorum]